MTFPLRSSALLSFGLGLAMVPWVRGANLVVNSEFEAGTTGWGQVGTVFTTGESGVLSDQGGERVVVFQTMAVTVPATLSLTLSFDFFNALSPLVGLGQTPDSVFASAFIGAEPFGGVFEDGVYAETIGLLDADFRGSVNFAPGMVLTPSPKGVAWTRHTVSVPVVSFVTVGFEFIDGNTAVGDSSAVFDNVYLIAEPIPEPAVAGLLAAAAAVFCLRRGRRRHGMGAAARGGQRFVQLNAVVLLLGSSVMAHAQAVVPPPLDPSLVRATAKAERSTLDRRTGQLTSTVDLEVLNVGTQAIYGPVHALVRFRDTVMGAEVRSGIAVNGALGGIDRPPHQVPYFDLSAQAADGWAPAEVVSFTVIFSRPRTVNVTYEVTVAGFVNAPPTLDPGGPYAGRVGEPIVFEAIASDPDGDPLAFAWDFGDGTVTDTGRSEHIFTTAGVKTVRVAVSDGRGGSVERDVTAVVIPDGDFALGHTRVVDGVGHPVGGVVVEEAGPDGERVLEGTPSGFVSLGTTEGAYGWKFSASGHRPVWRTAALADGEVRLVPSPWLAREGEAAAVSILESTVLTTGTGAGTTRVHFAGGTFTEPGAVRLTGLGPQTLPFPLPFGWSPLGAFHIEFQEYPTLPGEARVRLTDTLVSGEFLTLVRFEPETRTWRIVEARTLDPVEPDVFVMALAEGGTYATVVRDEGTGAPLPGEVGDPLPGGPAQLLSVRLAAVGVVDPAQKAASLDPEAVTTQAQAVFTPATGVLPSSSWFRIAVQETYDLADGTALRTPDYDTTVYAYRRPAGSIAAVESMVGARRLNAGAPRKLTTTSLGEGRPVAIFPLRPQVLFGPSELLEARLHVEVLPPLGDGAAALSAQGGVLESADVRVTVPPDALDGFAAGSLRALATAGFTGLAGPGQAVVRAFELSLGGLVDGATLHLSLGGALAPNTNFVLAQLVRFPGGSGLAPVQRFRTTAAGALTSVEPTTAPRLPGFAGPGQFLLVQLQAPQGLVSGLVTTATGAPAPGIGVRIASQRWLSVTGAAARYFLLAPAGAGTTLASHPTNGDGAAAGFAAPESLDPVTLNLALGALAPRILATTPPDGAAKISTVSPITVEISEKIAPASLGATPVALRADGASGDVPGGATLDLSGRFLTFLPTAPLDPGVVHTLTVSANLRDLQNLELEGPRTFSFTTAPLAARGLGAQLTIYEPGAAGPTLEDQALLDAIPGYTSGATSSHVAAVGSPGTAEAEVPVILINESTGATATVLSKADGSFANFVDAAEEDFISAVFVNTNGTRITIPASKQRFDDGRTGLFHGGGILEAESDEIPEPILVVVEPGSIPERSVFRIEARRLADVLAEHGEDVQEGSRLLGGLSITVEGDALTEPIDIAFPVDSSDLDLTGDLRPEDTKFVVAEAVEADGVKVFKILDSARYEEGAVRTASPPFLGLFGSSLFPLIFQIPTVQAVISGRVVVTPEEVNPTQAELLAYPGVPGAFVTGGLPSRSPGLVRGAFAAVTNRAGFYALTVPVGGREDPVAMRATSFRFPGQAALRTAVSEGSLGIGFETRIAHLAFKQLAGSSGDPRPPAIFPEAVTGFLPVGQEVSVFCNLVDNLTVPTVTAAEWVPAQSFSLPDGAPLPAADVSFLQGATVPQGSSASRVELKFNVQRSALVTVKLGAVDQAGNAAEILFRLQFRTPPPLPIGSILPSDSSDTTPPRVIGVNPGGGVMVSSVEDVTVSFSEAIATDIEGGLGVSAIGSISGGLDVHVDLLPDQTTARLRLSGMKPGDAVTLHFSASIRDLTGNNLIPHTETFSLAPSVPLAAEAVGVVAAVAQAGGVTISLERDTGADSGSLRLLTPGSVAGELVEAGRLSVPPFPRALAVSPRFALKVRPTEPVQEKVLVVVTGGLLGEENSGPWLWIVDITNPEDPRRLASGLVSPDFTTTVTKLLAKAGEIYALVLTGEGSFILQIGLQAFILGSNATLAEFAPPDGSFAGVDLNGDGDFVDPGEQLPRPSRNELWGLTATIPLDPTRSVVDFDVAAGGGFVSTVLRGNATSPPRYQTVLAGGLFIGDGSEPEGSLPLNPAAAQFRVALDTNVSVVTESGTLNLPVAAIVAEDATLRILDILSNPNSPSVVASVALPAGSSPIRHLAVSAGRYVVSTGRETFVVDPRRFALPIPPGAMVHPALGARLAVGAYGRSIGVSADSVTGLADGKITRLQLPPPIRLMRWAATPIADTATLAGQTDTALDHFINGLVEEQFITPSRLTALGSEFPGALATPPPPEEHYSVLIEASGDLGAELDLGIDSSDRRGRRLPPRGTVSAPVVLTSLPGTAGVDGHQPPVTPHKAYRLSSDPVSPHYNRYLSQPLLVTADGVSPEILSLIASVPGRQCVQVGEFLRIWIESAPTPGSSGVWLAPTPGDGSVPPTGVMATVPSFCADFLESPNPTMRQSSPQIQGVSLQSGEFTHTATDLVVEGRGLDLVLSRTWQSQTRWVGPFGRGWDSPFFRRLCEIPIGLVPDSLELPLVIYGDSARDQIAKPGDVLLQTGDGDLLLYRRIGDTHGNTALLPAFAADPAIADFDWSGKVAAWFEPPPGRFELFVRFSDGTYASVDQEATRFLYDADGRLFRIVPPYAEAALTITHRPDGKLATVKGDRGIDFEFGYYGRTTDPTFVAALDRPFPSIPQLGLIARVKAGVQGADFIYDDLANLLRAENALSSDQQVYGYENTPPYLLKKIGRGDGSLGPAQVIEYTAGLVRRTIVDDVPYEFTGAVATAEDRAQTPSGTLGLSVAGGNQTFDVDDRGSPVEFAGNSVAVNDNFQITSFGDGADRMETVYDTANPVYRFRGNQRIIRGKDGLLSSEITYDNSVWNRIASYTTPEGVTTSWSYATDSANPGQSVTARTGPVTRHMSLNPWGQITQEERSEAGVTFRTSTVLDASTGLPTGVRNGGEQTASVTRPAEGLAGPVTHPGGVLTPVYNSDGSMRELNNSNGPDLSLSHDTQTAAITSSTVTGDSGSMTETILPPDTEPTGSAGFSLTETGAPSLNGTYSYDDKGRLTGMAVGAESVNIGYDGLNPVSYQAPGDRVAVTYATGDPVAVTENGVTTGFTYDTLGRTRTLTQSGAVRTYFYGTGATVTGSRVDDPVFGRLIDETYTTDAAGRVDSVTDSDVAKTFTFFPDGEVRTATHAGAVRLERERDEAGRDVSLSMYGGFVRVDFSDFELAAGLAQTETHTGPGGSVVIRRTYDHAGRVLTERVGELPPSVDGYDEFGHHLSSTDPDGVTTVATWSPSGLPLTRTFSDGITVTMGYDANRRLTSIGGVAYGYNADDLVTSASFPGGGSAGFASHNAFLEAEAVTYGTVTQNHGYTHGRRTSITVPTTGDSLALQYDALGNLRRLNRNGLSLEYGYAPHYGVIRESGPLGNWSAPLNAGGFITTESYPSGASWAWNPNIAGLMTTHSQAGATAISWRDIDVLAEVQFSGGVKLVREFDESGRPFRTRYEAGGSTVAGFEWALSPAGRVESELRFHDGRTDVFHRNAPSLGRRVIGVSYNATDATGTSPTATVNGLGFPGSEIDWSAASVTGSTTPRSVVPSAADSLPRDTRGVATAGPVWVNLSGTPQKFNALFTYDGFNQLRRVQRLGPTGDVRVTVDYLRDGAGRIAERTVTGDPSECVPGHWRFAWHDDRLLEEYQVVAGTNRLLRRYLYASDELIGLEAAATPGGPLTRFVPVVAPNGSVGGYLTAAGALHEIVRYGLYGLPEYLSVATGSFAARSSVGGPLQYHGAFFDADAGLYDMGARTLHPVMGEFLQRDREIYDSTAAFFLAFDGDPVSNIDRDGAAASNAVAGRSSGWWARAQFGIARGGVAASDARSLSVPGGGQWRLKKNSKAVGAASLVLDLAADMFPPDSGVHTVLAGAGSVAGVAKYGVEAVEVSYKIKEAQKKLTNLGGQLSNLIAEKEIAESRPIAHWANSQEKRKMRNGNDPTLFKVRNKRADRLQRKALAIAKMTKDHKVAGVELRKERLSAAKTGAGITKVAFSWAFKPPQGESSQLYEYGSAGLNVASNLFDGAELYARRQLGNLGGKAATAEVSVLGGYISGKNSSMLMKGAFAFRGADIGFQIGFEGASRIGIPVALRALSGEKKAADYEAAVRQFNRDGGFGLKLLAGALSSAGLISDETTHTMVRFSDWSVLDSIAHAVGQAQLRGDPILRGLDAN